MSVIFEEKPGGTYVSGQVGPNMPVWSLFIAAYAILGIIASASLMFGYSQWSIGQSPLGLIIGVVSLVLMAVVYVIGKAGERLAEPQTQEMHNFLRTSLGVE